MKVLVVGGGGREHALAWKIAQSPRADVVFVAPGNAGTAADAELGIQNVSVGSDDVAGLVEFAKKNEVGLTVVGPEAPLVAGLVDALQESGLRAFGPSKAAAALEGSKVFCKDLLRHADVPSGDYKAFKDAEGALSYLNDREDVPLVVKADGLAAGKGVVVCDNRAEAIDAVERIASRREFGDAGAQLIIEERLHGHEASVLAITDGRSILTLPPAQDHKPAGDGDTGPNTGGMGAYCPTPLLTDEQLAMIEETVLVPTVHHMKRQRRPFQGVLYAGLMITKQGPKVLEYNVRLGDPECQPLLMRLKTDLLEVLDAAVDKRLDSLPPLEWDPRPAVCVVMASEGYPGSYEKGFPIRGLDDAAGLPDVKVFHAGASLVNGAVVNTGGRVLGVTAMGDTIAAAKLQAYKAVKCIRWQGAWCRKDISDKAMTYQ
ncbi:Phosphoribosylamine--glycine ligase [Posidoniimonas corsicana]|uniref:Phosphoribosylamine--glycine ligase n=1 Tax=Posidoniimonas corsicana TaxID=1938618 RepID=A0A5C5UUE5_9BACT|nr:phosphoribosylamine--glycine ligase [Posidoniimonas corsicana]TWT29409.1 Phosphoribosylamine--glycine ligase [Posidoniimonas corsicana]